MVQSTNPRPAAELREQGEHRDHLGATGQENGPVRLLARFPVLRRLPARMLGLGLRPEHVRTPELPAA